MNIKPISVEAYEVAGVQALDSMRVILQPCGSGAGRVTVEVYGESWSAFWNAMGHDSLPKFIAEADEDYLFNCLTRADGKRPQRHKVAYVKRIVAALRKAMFNLIHAHTEEEA